jgi:pimeloyl-ACP methyl ester carboxylesterase
MLVLVSRSSDGLGQTVAWDGTCFGKVFFRDGATRRLLERERDYGREEKGEVTTSDDATIEVGGVALSTRIQGEGPPVLFLHGLLGQSGSRALINQLASKYRVHVPSHPGWDASRPHPRLRSVSDLAELYAELREQLGEGTAVVGCSFGAWIATQMASTVDRSIPSLVLVSPIGAKVGGREDRDYLDLFAATHDEVMNALYSDPAAYPDFDQWDPGDFVNLARAQEAVARYAWCPYLHDPGLLHRLRRVVAPTLIVHGAKDRLVLNDDLFARFAAEIPVAKEAQVSGAGHLVEEERPEELAKLIVQHFEMTDRASLGQSA